ncbi:hypothetical protein SYNPS1DRAFT_12152 [Syncephalis pseudoplumigaleata]|uniref:Uncharacterized protein n=1 Tax=Syncephalis pseudoplumigaleata TaxID=1712513 RepID=A0A4P9Z5P5_9FUNG|nr:hypothetical protein SYNPS1DRAFT_12152 [Syncephalis pseudoplumigaleata]|eukprot:RKP27788.1 hypothetical protein SYNPS1DRAFT_12152 [Syncephalis pseudoplumigaleata]
MGAVARTGCENGAEPPLTPPAEINSYLAYGTTDGESYGHPQSLPDPLGLRRGIKSDAEIKRLCSSRVASKRRLGEFYREQNELIKELLRPIGLSEEEQREVALDNRRVQVAIYGSVVANVVLFLLQLFAAIDSGSLALFATMADAFMDLLSSVVLMLAGHEASKENLHKYPTGKSRMETIGIIVFSALMSTVSVQLMVESIRAFISKDVETDLTAASILCVCIALGTKIVLFFYCYALRKYPSADILAQDHRNDIIVNAFGLSMFLLGNHIVWWLDPSGAIIVAVIILRSWTSTAFEQIQLIIGKAADPAFLQRVIYIAYTHHEAIREVDTAQAYHVGSNVYVEVDIVMDPETTLRYSHDVGESLQMKLESLPNVERAFVHVDYESEHVPEHRKDR